jgi:hypothetical protein
MGEPRFWTDVHAIYNRSIRVDRVNRKVHSHQWAGSSVLHTCTRAFTYTRGTTFLDGASAPPITVDLPAVMFILPPGVLEPAQSSDSHRGQSWQRRAVLLSTRTRGSAKKSLGRETQA